MRRCPSLTTLARGVAARLSSCAAATLAGIWGKEFPVPAADSGTLDPVDAHRPVVYRKNGTLVFAIPSHNGFKPALDSLVEKHRAELSSADKLIIDLRGNEGGGSFMTNALEPFVRSRRSCRIHFRRIVR